MIRIQNFYFKLIKKLFINNEIPYRQKMTLLFYKLITEYQKKWILQADLNPAPNNVLNQYTAWLESFYPIEGKKLFRLAS